MFHFHNIQQPHKHINGLYNPIYSNVHFPSWNNKAAVGANWKK